MVLYKTKVVPDDVIDIIWNTFPVVTYGPRVAWVDTQQCVIKPVILVSLEEVSEAVGVSKDSVNWRRNTLPVATDWSRVAWVDHMTTFVVAVVIRPQKEIDEPVWPAEDGVYFTGFLRLRKWRLGLRNAVTVFWVIWTLAKSLFNWRKPENTNLLR